VAQIATTTDVLDYIQVAARKAEIATSTVKLLPDVINCESGFDPDATHLNKNGTTDISIFQINSIHIPEAKLMGLDIYNWRDNITFGLYLIQKHGLTPWNASKKCWGKLT